MIRKFLGFIGEENPWLTMILCFLMALLGFRIGLLVGDAELARLEASQATAQRDKLEEAVIRGDDLSQKLLKTEFKLSTIEKERDRALKNQTTGRACLSAGAVRLLNTTDSGATSLPEAAGRATTTDGAAATDTDVAEWINHAISQYDICRGRLDRLIDYVEGVSE
jgi:hypothetical protein